MQAAARPWAAGEMKFYGINRLIYYLVDFF